MYAPFEVTRTIKSFDIVLAFVHVFNWFEFLSGLKMAINYNDCRLSEGFFCSSFFNWLKCRINLSESSWKRSQINHTICTNIKWATQKSRAEQLARMWDGWRRSETLRSERWERFTPTPHSKIEQLCPLLTMNDKMVNLVHVSALISAAEWQTEQQKKNKYTY